MILSFETSKCQPRYLVLSERQLVHLLLCHVNVTFTCWSQAISRSKVCRQIMLSQPFLSLNILGIREVNLCRSWRTAILGDDQLLKKVHFQDAQSALPLMRRYSEGNACPKATGLPITQLIDKVGLSYKFQPGLSFYSCIFWSNEVYSAEHYRLSMDGQMNLAYERHLHNFCWFALHRWSVRSMLPLTCLLSCAGCKRGESRSLHCGRKFPDHHRSARGRHEVSPAGCKTGRCSFSGEHDRVKMTR